MMKNEWFAQMWGNKCYIMRYRVNPEKITFNPYKNEYEKIIEVHHRNSKLSVLVFLLGLSLGIFVSVLTHMLVT